MLFLLVIYSKGITKSTNRTVKNTFFCATSYIIKTWASLSQNLFLGLSSKSELRDLVKRHKKIRAQCKSLKSIDPKVETIGRLYNTKQRAIINSYLSHTLSTHKRLTSMGYYQRLERHFLYLFKRVWWSQSTTNSLQFKQSKD